MAGELYVVVTKTELGLVYYGRSIRRETKSSKQERVDQEASCEDLLGLKNCYPSLSVLVSSLFGSK